MADEFKEGAKLSEGDQALASRFRKFEAEPRKIVPEPTSQVDLFYDDTKDRYHDKTPEPSAVLEDLKFLIRADENDILDGRTVDPKADEKLKILSGMPDIVASLNAGQQVDDSELRKLGVYILRKEGENQEKGGKDQAIFTAFKELIPQRLWEVIEKPQEPESPKRQEKLSPYRHRPGNKTEAFFKERAEADQPATLEEVKKFVKAAKEDLESGKEAFESENAELIAVVDEAAEFGREHKEEIEKEKLIKVVEVKGQLQAGWKNGLDTTEKEYLFDPDPHSESGAPALGEYVQRRYQYTDKIEGPPTENKTAKNKRGNQGGIKEAVAVLNTLTKRRLVGTLKMSQGELLPVFRIIERHYEYLQARNRQVALRLDGDVEQLERDTEMQKEVDTILHQRDVLEKLETAVRERVKT